MSRFFFDCKRAQKHKHGIMTGAKGDNFGEGQVPIFAKTASPKKSDRRTEKRHAGQRRTTMICSGCNKEIDPNNYCVCTRCHKKCCPGCADRKCFVCDCGGDIAYLS